MDNMRGSRYFDLLGIHDDDVKRFLTDFPTYRELINDVLVVTNGNYEAAEAMLARFYLSD